MNLESMKKRHRKLSEIRKQIIILFFIGIVVGFSSCKMLNPTQMLRTPKNFQYSTFSDSLIKNYYIISPNDELTFRIYTLNGDKLIEQNTTSSQNITTGQVSYVVNYEGMVKLPIIRETKLGGMTEREAENYLESVFAEFLNQPFVQIKVTNKRVIIFPGGQGGNASVLKLQNNQTSLFEALASVGGISDGRADKIKLIRGDLKNPQIYLIDLSTLEGITKADLTLQANDIIIVEPRVKIPQKIISEISPYISLITTALLIYGIFK